MKRYAACVGAEWGREAVEVVRTEGVELAMIAASDWSTELRAMSHLLGISPRYAFFLNWSWIVPKEITDAVDCVNFHCTRLPYGRGGAPIENLILRGHTETVITAHRMTQVLDGGPVYGAAGPVSLAGTKAEILARFVEPVAELMQWIIETEPAPLPQFGEVVKFKRLSQEDYEAVWRGREEGR